MWSFASLRFFASVSLLEGAWVSVPGSDLTDGSRFTAGVDMTWTQQVGLGCRSCFVSVKLQLACGRYLRRPMIRSEPPSNWLYKYARRLLVFSMQSSCLRDHRCIRLLLELGWFADTTSNGGLTFSSCRKIGKLQYGCVYAVLACAVIAGDVAKTGPCCIFEYHSLYHSAYLCTLNRLGYHLKLIVSST